VGHPSSIAGRIQRVSRASHGWHVDAGRDEREEKKEEGSLSLSLSLSRRETRRIRAGGSPARESTRSWRSHSIFTALVPLARCERPVQLDISRRSPPVLLPCVGLPRGRRDVTVAETFRDSRCKSARPPYPLPLVFRCYFRFARRTAPCRFGMDRRWSCDSWRFASPRVDALNTVNKWIEVHYQPGQVFPSRLEEIRNNGQLSVDRDGTLRGKKK